jgi:HK97 family phage major capsid protein
VAVARKLKDGQGNYIWSQGYQAGEASSILGYSVVENHDLPDLAAGANSVLFGDFNRAYTIADVRGTRILRDPFTAKPYVTFYTTKRVGGGLMDSAAVVSLQPIA